jgi:hypothetical protein
LKMARELTTPHPQEDNNRDIAGYIGVLNRIKLMEKDLATGWEVPGGPEGPTS